MAAARKGRKLALLTALCVLLTLSLAVWLGWEHIHFYWLFEPLGNNEQGFPEYRHRETGIVMVKLPGGTFWMGAQKEDSKGRNYDPTARDCECPVHKITLSPFLIAKFEVTQKHWGQVMDKNPSKFKGDDLPVETVSWNDCQEFCRKTGLLLTSESQWEYSCMAGASGPIAGTGFLNEMAWYEKNSVGKSHPVGKKKPNDFGLYDTYGNVFEWCEDTYDEKFYTKQEAKEKDPVGRTNSKNRIVRGGCWNDHAWRCRSSSRGGDPSGNRNAYVGFRVCHPWPF